MAIAVVNPVDVPSTTANWFRINVGGDAYDPQFARKPYSITSADNDTIRFELRDGEQHWWDAAMGHYSERAEIAGKTLYQDGEPIHISYGFKLEEGAANTAKWMVLGQLHMGEWAASDTSVSPPFRIMLDGEKMAVYVGHTTPDGKNVSQKVYTDVYDIDRGHQYEMDVKVVFDAEGNGRLVVTRDNVVIVDYKGNVGYAAQKDVYWAQGIYRDSAATETAVAEYSHLKIETGNAVTFPKGEVYIGAPKLVVDSIGAAAADGSRIAHIGGTAKPGTSVTITDGKTVLGVAKVDADGNISYDLKIPKASELFLHATAADDAGHKGVAAYPISIEVGTAAEIAGRLLQIAQQGNVGSVVLTDSNILKIPGGQIYYLLNKAAAALDKIQGEFSFLETYQITGKTYDRQDIAYTSDGVITERLRYAANKLVYDEKLGADGSKEIVNITAAGAEDHAFYGVNGQLTRLEKYDANHKISFQQINHSNGSVETTTWNAATGLASTHNIVYADKSRIAEELNIVGRVYTKQAYGFDKSGALVSQERFDADGTKLWWQLTKSDGTRETHNYDGVTGKELSYSITRPDGTRDDGKFDVSGKAYAGIVTHWSAANKLIGTDTYDANGKLLESDKWNADGSHTVYTIDKATGVATGFKLYLANGTITETIYPVVKPPVVVPTAPNETVSQDGTRTVYTVDESGSKIGYKSYAKDGSTVEVAYHAGTTVIDRKDSYDSTGRFAGIDRYDAKGNLISHDVRNVDGTMEVHQYNAAGKETGWVTVGADGTRTYASLNIVGKPYDMQKVIYDASNQLVEMSRWSDGKVVMSQFAKPDGTEHLVNISANGTKTDTVSLAGKIVKVDSYDSAGRLTLSEVRNADGSKELHRFDAATGKELGYSEVAADKTRYEMSYDIKGKSYDQQFVHFDKSGAMIELSRWADGHLLYQQSVDSTGTEVRNFDLAGRTTLLQNLSTDGSREVHMYEFATPASAVANVGARLAVAAAPEDPIRIQVDHYGTNGARTYTDIKNANGTHDQIAYASGVKLTSHAGVKDVFTSAGNDRFVFDEGFGNDVIRKFVTAGAAHDVIQIDHDLADAFSDLVIRDQGADTVISFSPTDTITLTGVKAAQLNHEHFLFV